ncbi:MAG TPA: hypothetical protein VKS21_02830 [Spirochaetota bacterium]|nr:hypothetical protein [Spirochaetota bacterium]
MRIKFTITIQLLLFFLLNAHTGKDFIVYQYAGYSYTITEYTRTFGKESPEYHYGETNENGLVYDYTGFLTKNDLNVRTVVKYKYFYIPFNFTLRKEKHIGYSTNNIHTEKSTSFFPDPRNVFFINSGLYATYKSFSLGFSFNKLYTKNKTAYPESKNYWHCFNTNNNYSSYNIDFLIDQKIFKLPFYLLSGLKINPQTGLHFNKHTIYKINAGLRLDFNYYISSSLLYNAFLGKTRNTRHMFTVQFNYNVLAALALRIKYACVYFADNEFPASRFDIGMEYIWTKDFKNDK